MRVSLRSLLGTLLVLLLLASLNQAPLLADAGTGPWPPMPDDSVPVVDSDVPPESPDDGLGLIKTIIIIILPII